MPDYSLSLRDAIKKFNKKHSEHNYTYVSMLADINIVLQSDLSGDEKLKAIETIMKPRV